MGESQPKLKLYYFNIVGRGESIRLLCAHTGLELEEHTFDVANRTEFAEMKAAGKFHFGQVPCLEVTEGDGKVHQLVQSSAIMRYLGKLGGVYPKDDDLLAAKVDAAMAQETDAFTGTMVVTYSTRFGICLDDDAKKKSQEAIASEVAPRHFQSLEKLLEASTTGWIADTKEPSPADFVWYVKLAMSLPASFPEDLRNFKDYPKIKAFVEKFKSLESIKNYYGSKK